VKLSIAKNVKNVITYKAYAARVDYDDEDGLFVGHVAGTT